MNPPPCVGHAHRHIRSRLNSSEFNDYRLKTDILLAQYAQISETARKFVDRQTQAFYFTLVVYGGVIAAIAPMIGSSSFVNGPSALIATIGQMSESQICLILLLTQVAVPLLVFPLLMLFIDAELWMIGVGKTIIQPIRDDFAKFPVQGIRFPDDWTETVSRHVLRQQRVHWHRITTGRLVVFLYGPVFGLCSPALIWMVTRHREALRVSQRVLGVAALGCLCSLVCLLWSAALIRTIFWSERMSEYSDTRVLSRRARFARAMGHVARTAYNPWRPKR